MSRFSKPFVTHGNKSPAFWQIGILWQVMATGNRTENKFVMLDQVLEQYGAGPTTHTHVQDEGLYVVSGRCTFNAGGIHGMDAGPGTFVAVPGDTEHSFIVEEPGTRMLNFYTPAGFEMLLMGVARPAEKREPPPPELMKEMLPSKWVTAHLNDEHGVWNKYSDVLVDGPNPEHMRTEPTPGATIFPFVANISKGTDNFHYGNALWGLLASGERTGGSYTLFELKLRQGSLQGPRIFADHDVMFFVVSGRMTFFLGEETQEASDGALVWIPRGTIHSVRTISAKSRCLYFLTPGGFERYIKLMGTPAEGAEAPPVSFNDKIVDDGAKRRVCSSLKIQNIAIADPLFGTPTRAGNGILSFL